MGAGRGSLGCSGYHLEALKRPPKTRAGEEFGFFRFYPPFPKTLIDMRL